MVTLSFEEALGTPPAAGKKSLSFEEALGAKSVTKPVTVATDSPSALPKNPADFMSGLEAKRAGNEDIAVADMILGFPAFLAKMGTRGLITAGKALAGNEAPAGEATQLVDKAMEAPWNQLMINPVAFLTGRSSEGTLVDKFGKAVADPVENAAKYWTDKTGRPDVGEAVKQSLDILMARGGDVALKGAKTVTSFAQDSFSKWASKRADAVPEAERQAGQVSPETAARMLDEYSRETGDTTLTARQVKVAADADINATNKAYELMQKGASLKETQYWRNKNPLIGAKLDEMMARREEVMKGPMAETVQGEVLPPEAKPALPDQEAGSGVVVDQPLPPSRQIAEKGEADPRLLAAIAAGGTAALLAYKDQDLAAAGLGAAVMGMTGGRAAEALRAPASAMVSAFKDMRYSTKLLETIPKNWSEVPKKFLQEQFKRQDVTKAEKDLLQGILDDVPGDTVKATELADKFKLATGDFELGAKLTRQYADYGMENIGRDAEHASGPRPGHVPTTTLYRLPEHMEVSAANHFNDARLYGWTRSFKEDGVRHVVEVQSDLAQHAKGVSPEQLARLKDETRQVKANIAYLQQKLEVAQARRAEHAVGKNLGVKTEAPVTIDKELRRERLHLVELEIKAREQQVDSQLSPILKNSHRRLIREELKQAAESGEAKVRFADADTVAKVEGWPDGRANTEARLADLERQLSHAQLGGIGRSGLRPEEAASRIQQLIDHEKSIIRELPEGRSFSAAHQSIYNRYAGDYTRYLKSLGGKEVRDADGHGWIEVPTEKFQGPIHMHGKVDPQLLKAMAAAGTGATLMASLADEDKLRAALKGGALGLLLAFGAKPGMKAADVALGGMMTRVRNISPALAERLQKYEYAVKTRPHAYIEQTTPFFDALGKVPGEEGKALARAISTNDTAAIRKGLIATGDLTLIRGWNTIRKSLDDIGAEAKKLGVLRGMLSDYFPRIVVDREGLLNSLGQAARSTLEDRLVEANKESLKKSGDLLTPVQEAHVINQVMRGYTGKDFKPGFTKGRTIQEITPDLQQFYASPVEAYHTYVRTMLTAIEKAKLFGKGYAKTPEGYMDLEGSVGNLIREEMQKGKLSREAEQDLLGMFKDRFGPGEQGAHPAMQFFKNAVYAGLLANVVSATKQFADVASTAATQGMLPTAKAVVQKLTGKERVHATDFGLVESISAEFANQAKSSKTLNAAMKIAGFSKADLIGKDVNLNASLAKAEKLVKTPAGIQKLASKYQAAFGDEFPQLVRDLQQGKWDSENVRLYQFSELARIQPITKSELPQLYHRFPNGRAAYMLNSFTLKQFDMVRTDAYADIKAGKPVLGMGKLLRYGMILGLANATINQITDWMLGKETEELNATTVGLNVLKNFGMSEYQLKNFSDTPLKTVLSLGVPPFEMFDTLLKTGEQKADGTRDWRAVQYLPIIGRPLYYHVFGGKDLYNAKQQAKRDKELLGE